MSNTLTISETTQSILKNFSGISDQILLIPGVVQRTVLQSKSVFAVATLAEAWPQETAIYRLGLFLQNLSQFDKPVVQFDDDGMMIFQEVGTRLRIKQRYSDPTTVQAAPNRTLPSDSPSVEVIVSSYTLSKIKKAAAINKLTHFTVTAKNGSVTFRGDDPKIPNSNQFEIDILASDFTFHDADYERTMRFSVEHFGYLMDGEYVLYLKDWKYGYFENKSLPVTYFVAEDKQID